MSQMPGISDAPATALILPPAEGSARTGAADGGGQLRALQSRVNELEGVRERLRQGVRQLRTEGEAALRERDEARAVARAEHDRAERLAAELQRVRAGAEAQVLRVREDAEAALSRLRGEHEGQLSSLRNEHQEQARAAEDALSTATGTVRGLRLELGREKQLAYQRAVEVLREEHLKEIAKSHQNGKNKGVAVTMAYLEAAKEEGADLGRTSDLATAVLTRSAARFDSDFLNGAETGAEETAMAPEETSGEDVGSGHGNRRGLFALPRAKMN